MSWSPSLKTKGDAFLEDIKDVSTEDFTTALDQVAFQRLSDFQRGVKAYHEHAYRRELTDPEVIWEEGNTRLLDYGGPEDGPVLFCVPSLINRAYVLDLSKRRSFVRSMVEKGLRVYLLDWGPLGPTERAFNLNHYIAGRLHQAFEFVRNKHAKKIHLLGYCMGGVMATAYASLHSEKLASLILLATPWDFHAGEGNHKKVIETSKPMIDMGIKMLGVLSVDAIQGLFSAIDPYQVIKKFQKFADLKPSSAKAEHFVAMEDWLNDGVPIAGEVARECLFDWYLENKPMNGRWQVADQIIDPSQIKCPTLIYVADRDRIVLPESSMALNALIKNSRIKHLDSGHVGMVCGHKAVGSLYSPLSKWVLNQGM